MKAIINELWNTGIDVITTKMNDEGFPELEIESVADLKKCENVLVVDKRKGIPYLEIILNDVLIEVYFRTVTHPSGAGSIRVCEVILKEA